MPKIVDVILHSVPAYKMTQTMVVLDSMPNFRFERRGFYLRAEDDGLYECYYYELPTKHSQAFAGREFNIAMDDGSTVKATGQWWSGGHQKNAPEPIVDVGIATKEMLSKCYVFMSGHISKAKLDAWLSGNTASTDYYKYRAGVEKGGAE